MTLKDFPVKWWNKQIEILKKIKLKISPLHNPKIWICQLYWDALKKVQNLRYIIRPGGNWRKAGDKKLGKDLKKDISYKLAPLSRESERGPLSTSYPGGPFTFRKILKSS